MSCKRSVVWELFQKQENNVSKCIRCNKLIRYAGNTSNMFSHIKHYHPRQFYEIKKEKEANEQDLTDGVESDLR